MNDERRTLNVMAGMLGVAVAALRRRRNRWLDGHDSAFVIPVSKPMGLRKRRKVHQQAVRYNRMHNRKGCHV